MEENIEEIINQIKKYSFSAMPEFKEDALKLTDEYKDGKLSISELIKQLDEMIDNYYECLAKQY